jgi:leucyl aminopeptidase (aminopeptidase T)
MNHQNPAITMSIAHRIVNQCLRINDKDNVTIFFYPHNLTLAEDISEECFKKGADVNLSLYTDRFYQAYLKELNVESLREPSVFCKALSESSTAEVWLSGVYDPSIFQKLPPEKMVADGEGESKAHGPYAKKTRALEVLLALVTKPRAKTYGFNFEKWQKMILAVSNVDYGQLTKTGRQLRIKLSKVRKIQITASNGTKITFEPRPNEWNISDGVIDSTDIKEKHVQDSIPTGALYNIPEPDSADGTIVFNTTTPYAGMSIGKVKWRFTDGKLTAFQTDSSSRKLKDEWTKATGDKSKLAQFTIGFNPKAETGYSINHIALGAVTVAIGGNSIYGGTNKSGFHFAHTLTGATLKADGKTILKNGKLQL